MTKSSHNPTKEELEILYNHKIDCFERWKVKKVREIADWLHRQDERNLAKSLAVLREKLPKIGKEAIDIYFKER